MKKKEHYLYLDILNILACFAVIVLHCSGVLEKFSKSPTWVINLALQTVAYWAVAIFFMISGATLMGYREKYSTAVFLKKRIVRIVIPFIAWSAIYLVYNSIFLHSIQVSSVKDIVSLFLSNGIVYIFYFFYALIGIYCIVPVISILAEEKYKRVLEYAIVIIFCVAFLQRDFEMLIKTNITADFQVPLSTGYMCYFLCGWYLSHYKLKKWQKNLIYGLGLMSMFIMFAVTLFRSFQLGYYYPSLRSYMSVTNFLMAMALFVFIKNLSFDKLSPKVISVIRKFSSASLGVYLIQMIFYPLLWRYLKTGTILYMLAAPIPLYLFCVSVVLMMKKIPFVRKLFP